MSNFARRCLFFIALFVLSSWELTSGSVVRAADSAYDIRLSSNVTIVNSGDWAVIKVDYSCSAVYSVPCQNVVISTLIPPELGRTISDVQVLDSSGMTTTSYDAATSTARWAFKNDIAPGAAGYVELRVRFPQGSTPDETIALLQAMMSGSNSPTATSNQLPLTANADPYMQVAKRFVSGGVVDLPTVYQVESCVPSSSGSLDVTNIVMRDTLPANAVFVSATDGGTYDAATNTIIWPVEDILVSAGETCLTHSVTVRFPSSSFVAGDEVRNNLDVDGTALGGTHISRSAFDTRLIQPPTPGASFGKSGPSTAEVGQEITYTFTERNEGTSPLSNHSVTDVIPTDLQVSRINAAAHNQPTTIRLQIEYQTNLNATWSNATPAPLTGAACIDVTRNTGCAYTLTLSGGEWITALRYTYLDDLPYGFSVTGHGFRAIVLSTPTNQIIVNTADSTYSFNGHQILSQSTARTRIVLYVASARPRITKAATPTIAHSGDVVTYTLTLRNETFRSLTMPLQDPHITDLLPTSLIYVDGSQAVTSRPIGAPDPAFEVLPNFNNSGRSLLRWRWSSYSLAAGQTMTVQFRVRIAPYTVAGTISNNAYLAGWGNQPSNILTTSCVSTSTDSQDFDSDGNSQEQICNSGTTNISLAAAASSGSLKLVKGQLDSTWSYDPSHGYTVPGGRADYQLTITNTGSIAISELTLLDILPWVGDVGVKRFNDPRQSEWRPFLAQPIEVPSGASVFYSTQNNPCRAPDLGIDPTNDSPSCSTPIWFSEPPTDISTVQSFKINFGNLVLQPSDAVTILVHLQAPYGGTVGEIAWNSFGYRARAVGSTEYLLAPEPPRVGIERQEAYPPGYGDYVWLDRNQNGLQDVGETGLNGVRVELFRDSDGILGPSAGDTFIAAKSTGPDDAGNPGYYIFNESFASSDPRYPGFLPPGNYYSRVVPPPGSRIAPQNIGADDTIDSDADPSSGYTAVTNLIAGEVDQTWDTGLIPSTAVGNYVWIDRNENGLQDDAPGDGVNGVTVRLYRSDGTLIRTTLTQDDNSGRPGYYLFDGLMAGDYYVEFVRPSSFASFTSQASGNRAQDSDASPTTGRTSVFSLGENQYDDTRDAGLILTSGALRLGNQVWRDLNNDGLFTPATGEYGIDNVSISLYRDSNNNSVADAGENVGNTTTSTHMGQAGWYQFSNLAAGNYIAVIDASNFAAGGALAGMRSSTGNEPTPDPDNNVDNDDNGDMLGGRVVSKQITVSVNGEPSIAVDGDDANGNQTLDFGVINGASLGNVVWFDTNSNGQQDSGEPGVAGVTVELLDNGSNVLRTTTTDQNGRYGFSELSGGSYQVRFGNLPVGYSFTTSNTGSDASDSDPDPTNGTTTLIALTDNQIDLTWDAGLVASVASIGDRVWADLNHDGLQDAAEPGVNGVTVTLYRSNGLQIATTTTSTVAGADGSYSFTNLPPGNYYIVFSNLPSGYAVSPQNIGSDDTLDSDADSATRRTAITTLAPGENDSSWDLGIFAYASIGNYVWYDTNHDGVQDATESGVPNVTVRLYRPGSNTAVASTTTNASGIYRFTNLIPGDFYLEFVMPNGYRASARDVGGNSGTADLLDTDPDINTYQTPTTTLDPSEDDTSWDFGIFQTSSIGDLAWLDQNANGIQESGEVGVAGVEVILHDSSGNEIASTVTNASGNYSFSGLIPGNYSLEYVPPTSYLLSPAHIGSDYTIDSDVDASLHTPTITLAPGQTDPSWDIGLYQAARLGDRVWHDRNANGVQDPSEPGIANVTVTLYQPGSDGAIGGGDDIQVGTSFTTDANGNYLFTGLVPGTYYVAFDMPTGYDAISPQHIGTSESDSDADQSTRLTSLITLGSGSIDRSSDMGVYQRARIGQRVWEDSDHNGVFDTGEDGVAGVTVSLYTGSGSLVITRTTDTNGDFFFDDLNPGEYYLVFDRPGGWTISPQNHGSDDNIDSDADPLTGQTQHITLASGAEDLSWWMGISRPATAITLLSFRVTHQTSGNMLKWETGSEMRSAGFEIYRSTTGSRADAELISGSRIPTRGVGGGGAQYQWMDSSANIKVDYTYWLVEIEIGGARKEYEQQAPTLQQIWSTFLPQVAR